MVISVHDPSTIYLGSQMLLRSTDRGLNWTQISPDLTFDIDRSKLSIMDVLPSDSMLSRHDGVEFYSTVTVLAESPLNRMCCTRVATTDGSLGTAGRRRHLGSTSRKMSGACRITRT